jgi:hypothetical protein
MKVLAYSTMDNNKNNSIKFNILICKLNSTSACYMASTKTQNTKTVQIRKSKNTKQTKQEINPPPQKHR